MSTPIDRGARRFLLVLLLLYFGFVIYGSLVPLDYRPLPLDAAWARFLETPFLDLGIGSRADWVANLLLFTPLAFLMMQVLVGERGLGARLTGATLIFLSCFALALSIEFTQLFFPPRTVSQNDILAEALGALIGISLHVAYGKRVIGWITGWWLAERGQALATRALHGYLIVMLAFSVLPLDLTLSPVELAHKFEEGRVNLIPFATLPDNPVEAFYKLATDALLWLPVAILWRLGGASVWRIAMRGMLVAAAIEFLQLFVFSRYSNITDVIMGGIGCYLGARLVPAGKIKLVTTGVNGATSTTENAPAQAQPAWVLPRLPWLALCAVWAVLTLAVFWYPFDFDLSADALSQRLSGLMRVPFESYYRGSEFHAINELFRKVLMFVPGGLLWAAYVQQGEVWARRPRIWLGSTLAILMALTVEGGQLFLQGKVADLTDAVLSASGALGGLFLGLRVMGLTRERRDAGGQTPARSSAGAPAVGSSRTAWLFDAIAIGILTVVLSMASKIDAVPYNVRELFAPGMAGVATALGLALACWWLFVTPLLLLERWHKQPEKATWLSAILPALGAVGALLLIPAVPTESLFDILGSPVLAWPANLELIGRYMALHAVLALAICGAVFLLARLSWRQARYLLPRWLITALLWAIPLHWIVVSMAATDNLTELMRDGGGPLASLYLFGGLLAFFTAASAFAAALVVGRRRGRLLVAALMAWPAAAGLLWLGSEQALFKYGKLFSAAQFLLSANREHYAQGMELGLRFMVASMAVFLLVTLLQAARWRRIAALLHDAKRAAQKP